MPYRPAKLIQINLGNVVESGWWNHDDGTGDPWIGYAYQWTADLTINAQTHSSHITPTPFYFDGNDIKVGDYITTVGIGRILQIIAISSQDSSSASVTLEDVDRVNTFSDPDQNGAGSLPDGDGYLFEAHDGYPILFPIPDALSGSLPPYFAEQIMSRFFYRKQSYEVYVDQVAHGFSSGNAIYLTSGASAVSGFSGAYHLAKADASGTANVIGIVTETGVPGPDKFRYRPVGPVVQMPMPSGIPGSNVYLSSGTAGGMTITPPSENIAHLFIKIDDNQGVWVGGRGLGGGGQSGFSGFSGLEGVSGQSGTSGYSGYSGASGIGISGYSGFSGFSGERGPAGTGIQEKPLELVYEHSGLAIPERIKVSRTDSLKFPTATDTGIDFGYEVPDDYDLGTDLQIVGSFYTDAVETATIRIKLDFEVVDIGDDAIPAGPTGTVTLDIPNPSTASGDTASEFVLNINSSNITAITERLRFTLQRNGTHGNDDYSGNVFLENVCLKYTGFGATADQSGISGFSGSAGIGTSGLFQKIVEDHSSGDTLTISESGSIHTNTSAGAQINLNLPTASVSNTGLFYTFICDNANGIKVTADSSDYIRIDGNVTSGSGGDATCSTVGSVISLVCIKQNYWYADSGILINNWSLS